MFNLLIRTFSALISSALLSLLLTAYSYIQSILNNFQPDLSYFWIYIFYLMIVYIFLGIPISILIDKVKLTSYIQRLLLYLLGGSLIGFSFFVLLAIDYPRFSLLDGIYYSVIGIMASVIFLHVNILITKKLVLKD